MNRPATARVLSLLALIALAACSSGSDATGDVRTGGNFVVLGTEPLNNGRLFLNDPIRIDFSNPVDLGTADLSTISFQVLDQNGNPLAEQPSGTFEIGTSPGDDQPGRRLLFIPRFPTNDTYDNGGFRPGRTYLVNLVGGDRVNGTVLTDVNGRPLLTPRTFRFSTADGTSPAQLFRNTAPGGPRRIDFAIAPSPGNGVLLNKFGTTPLELRLVFDQPINPHSANVPVALDTNPLLRNRNDRGRVYLEYVDPGSNPPGTNTLTWIPADVEIETNSLNRAVILMRPVGVLPNNADIRVIVENTFEDISGESNVGNAAYNPRFATFRTRPGYEPQFDALIEDFLSADRLDFDAPYLEPQAELASGFLRAGFEFEGTPTQLEYRPSGTEVRLNTDFTQIVPATGLPFNVAGGVFNFANVSIPQGTTVFGEGTRPMVWLVSGDFEVQGTLTVRGGNGDRVNTLNSANFPAAAGPGTCGGGSGGRGSPNSTSRSAQGETGFGPGQRPGGGGRPGVLSCQGACQIGSGGGGGSFATQGDPWYKVTAGVGTAFQQQVGIGGQGCTGAAGAASRVLPGGSAGPLAFIDARSDNNFWGQGVNVFRQIRIRGELAAPIGGQGGGGGGDLGQGATPCNVSPGADPNFINDRKGGGGGGGGGVLIVKALGRIIIGPSGNINADGGHGGGGEEAGSCNRGGGGGAGSGGMVILMAGEAIELHAHGDQARVTYEQNDYRFSISADGGVCLTGSFSTPNVSSKYPANGQQPMSGTLYDSKPLGALGGMGIVQLMAPPGADVANQTDQTNTVLDDNIVCFGVNGQLLSGQQKIDLLAWRGFPNANGVLVDDRGVETAVGSGEGDIRPTPILLPVPFSAKTRGRSEWIDLGAAKRRRLTGPDNLPRGIVVDPTSRPELGLPDGLQEGPTYEFAGVQPSVGMTRGYVAYEEIGGISVAIDYPEVLSSPAEILSTSTGGSVEGAAAYRVELEQAVLGSVADRYSHYEAELFNQTGTKVGSFRILAHTDRVLMLAAADGVLPASAVTLQVTGKFFQVVTNGSEGLGQTYRGSVGGRPVPIANVKIGFAFHKNPQEPDLYMNGTRDRNRYPEVLTEYAYDLEDPAMQETVRLLGAPFVQYDVLFDTEFRTNANDVPPSFGPSSPRPELHFLRLPFRF